MFQEVVLLFTNPVAAIQAAQALDQQYHVDQLTGLGLFVQQGVRESYPSYLLLTFESYPTGMAEVRQRYAAQVTSETIDGVFAAYHRNPQGWLFAIPSATPPLLQATVASLPAHPDYARWVQGN